MQMKANTNIEHIIAKIDNDFNPDNSDWIPRVAAWTIDAMSQLNVLCKVRKKKQLIVKDRIAYSECNIDGSSLKVYDNNGCIINKAGEESCCNDSPSTGDVVQTELASTTTYIDNGNINEKNYVVAETENDKYPYRYNIQHYNINDTNQKQRNYVLVGCDKIELNFDTNKIIIEFDAIETYSSDIYGCDLPVIPNNGILIEAIVYYCMYKMLCRGYKHPVFNLQASQYGTNPYYMWHTMKEEAKRSILIDGIDEDVTKIFRSTFFIDTFDPKR
nr:MAG TPA: hypothetical protein [Crassvirales sp.]